MPNKPCLTCGTLHPGKGPRCPRCEAGHQTARNARRSHYAGNWDAVSKRTIAAWVQEHGYSCPGYGRGEHLATDLTLDHDDNGQPGSVLCRSCNSRRGTIEPVFRNPAR